MKNNFESVQGLLRTPEEQEILKDLFKSKAFETFKTTTENYLLKLTSNLILGTEVEKGISEDTLKELRGFTKIWQIITKTNDES